MEHSAAETACRRFTFRCPQESLTVSIPEVGVFVLLYVDASEPPYVSCALLA